MFQLAQSRNNRERRRWIALYLISKGMSGNEASELVDRSSGWISKVVKRYNELGPKGVADQYKSRRGRRPKLDERQQRALVNDVRRAIKEDRAKGNNRPINVKKLAAHIEVTYGVELDLSTVRRYLHKWKLSDALEPRGKRREQRLDRSRGFVRSYID